MKIGIVCFPTYGGSGIIATELAHSLSSRHEVHLVSHNEPVRLEKKENLIFHKVKFLDYPLFETNPYSYTLPLTSKLVEITQSEKLDLIHAHYAIPHAVSAYLAKEICKNNIKIITTLHGTDSYLVGILPSLKPVTQLAIQKSDGLTAVSRYLKRITLNSFNVSKKIEVIPNFVDHKKFMKIEKSQNQKIIIHSSNFRPVKRTTDIIKAFEKISREINCKLILIGHGPELLKTKKLAKNLKLLKKISFLGNVTNIKNILGKSDVFLLPSEIESFGLSALEAMSCQVPVVASNVGGLKELISNGKEGYLTDVGATDKIAHYTIKILQDPELQKKLGKNARKKVLKKYIPDIIVPKYETFYREILESNRS
jgi:N-acetyl-alpha-D-glucosaminyl L-malate synthase BshA